MFMNIEKLVSFCLEREYYFTNLYISPAHIPLLNSKAQRCNRMNIDYWTYKLFQTPHVNKSTFLLFILQ